MTKNPISLEQAIQALNEGKKVRHKDFIDGLYLIKMEKSDTWINLDEEYFVVRHDVMHGVDARDPTGNVYYKEEIAPVWICNEHDEKIAFNPHFKWVNDDSKRCFDEEGWVIV